MHKDIWEKKKRLIDDMNAKVGMQTLDEVVGKWGVLK